MPESDYDVIIVGGGPAGSTCAIFFKKQNPALKVCIIDKQHFPRKKSCGDGLSPGVADIIHEAGIEGFFSEKTPISIFQLACSDTVDIKYDLKNMGGVSACGFVFPREFFDDKLIKHAAAMGADIFEDHEITDIRELDAFSTAITCRNAGDSRKFTGKIIVGADGVHSRIRSHLKVVQNTGKHSGIALRYYCSTEGFPDTLLRIDILKNLKNSYGWVFPVSENVANIGIGIDADVHKKYDINLNREFNHYLAFLEDKCHPKIMPGTRSGYPLPYGSQLPDLVYGNKILIGDAASMINPLTGEGIYYAMNAGMTLAHCVADNFSSDDELRNGLREFSDTFMHRFKNHYQLNLTLKKMLASPFSGLLLKTLAKDKDLLNKAMGIVLGNTADFNFPNLRLKMLSKSKEVFYSQFRKRFF